MFDLQPRGGAVWRRHETLVRRAIREGAMTTSDIRCPDCGEIHWTRGRVAIGREPASGEVRLSELREHGPDEWTCSAEGCGYRVNRPSPIAVLLDDIAHLRVP